MSDVSDEMLMEYADGVLDAQKIARLEKQLAGDATLALRLQAFERTRTGELARVFDPVLHAPVPQRLTRAASATPASLPPRSLTA